MLTSANLEASPSISLLIFQESQSEESPQPVILIRIERPARTFTRLGMYSFWNLIKQLLNSDSLSFCRPCFVVDPVLGKHLIRYNNKEEVTPSGSQNSVYQRGFRCIYANPVPVAQACQMGVDVVRDTLDTIWKALEDLIMIHDRDINLQFGFANVRMINRKLKVIFADYLTKEVTQTEFEDKMKRMNSPVSTLWKTNQGKMF